MRLLLGLILSTLLATPAWAQQEKWEGYRYATDLDLPFLDYVLDSVVRIETVGSFVDAKNGPDEIIDVSKRKRITNAKQLTKDKIAFQVETCRNQGLRYCPVVKRSSFGTGFFIEGKKFYTCRHAFHNWLVWAAKANNVPVETLSPPIILRTNEGKVIYHSATFKREQLLKFSFLNTDPRMLYVSDYTYKFSTEAAGWYAQMTDITEMQSEISLVNNQPLKIISSFSDIETGSETYLFGYSAKVDGFSGGNVNGKNITVSNGFIMDPISELGVYKTSNYFFNGMSGSVMITAKGEIAGMSCSRLGVSKTITEPQSVKALVMPIDKSYLNNLWSQIDFNLM